MSSSMKHMAVTAWRTPRNRYAAVCGNAVLLAAHQPDGGSQG